MRKVNLTMKEEMMYDIIKVVCLGKVSKQFAANKLNVTRRTINRRIYDYKLNGKEAFSHKNKTKKPKTTIDLEVRQLIIEFYKTKYYESNFIHFKQLLEREEMIIVSIGFIRNLMKEHKIISPLARRKTKREYLKQKKLMNKNSNSALIDSYTDKEVEYQLLLQSEAHPRKPRAKYAGETIQLDASVHYWIAGEKWYLHAAIDDATGNIVAAYFDKQETLKGYYNILFQILNNYGIPYEFVTDKRTVFEYKKKNVTSLEKDTFTQFGYACHQLGTSIITTSIPQAKGRVERFFGTLQSRLPIEMRINNINSLEDVNNFLAEYIIQYNQ